MKGWEGAANTGQHHRPYTKPMCQRGLPRVSGILWCTRLCIIELIFFLIVRKLNLSAIVQETPSKEMYIRVLDVAALFMATVVNTLFAWEIRGFEIVWNLLFVWRDKDIIEILCLISGGVLRQMSTGPFCYSLWGDRAVWCMPLWTRPGTVDTSSSSSSSSRKPSKTHRGEWRWRWK